MYIMGVSYKSWLEHGTALPRIECNTLGVTAPACVYVYLPIHPNNLPTRLCVLFQLQTLDTKPLPIPIHAVTSIAFVTHPAHHSRKRTQQPAPSKP